MNARPIQTKSDSGFAFPGGAQAFQRRSSALPIVILCTTATRLPFIPQES